MNLMYWFPRAWAVGSLCYGIYFVWMLETNLFIRVFELMCLSASIPMLFVGGAPK